MERTQGASMTFDNWLIEHGEKKHEITTFESRKNHWKWRYKNSMTANHVFYNTSIEARMAALEYVYEERRINDTL